MNGNFWHIDRLADRAGVHDSQLTGLFANSDERPQHQMAEQPPNIRVAAEASDVVFPDIMRYGFYHDIKPKLGGE